MQPKWTIADPICTFVFCILVLISTLNVLKDALRVLMEGAGSLYLFWSHSHISFYRESHSKRTELTVVPFPDPILSQALVTCIGCLYTKPDSGSPLCLDVVCFLMVQWFTCSMLGIVGTPKHINYKELKEDLEDVEGVRKAHSLYVWSLTLNRTALAAHLVIGKRPQHNDCCKQDDDM